MATLLYTNVRFDEYQQTQRELAFWKMRAQELDKRVRELNDEIRRIKK